jgi:hypothetical protein
MPGTPALPGLEIAQFIKRKYKSRCYPYKAYLSGSKQKYYDQK